MVGQADRLQVRVAIGDRAEQHPPFQAQQRRHHIVVGHHGIAGGKKMDHGVLDLVQILARRFEGGRQPGAPQGAEVEVEFGLAGQQGQPRLAQIVDRETFRHAGRMLGHPRVQGLLGLQDDGGDRPQGVIEVEQDGLGPGAAWRRRHGRLAEKGSCQHSEAVPENQSVRPAWPRLQAETRQRAAVLPNALK